MNRTKKVKTDEEIANSFEQDPYEIQGCLEYYIGIDEHVLKNMSHPDHLWTLLDRIHSDLMPGELYDKDMTEEQRAWMQSWISKWMEEIEPYCVRLEPE